MAFVFASIIKHRYVLYTSPWRCSNIPTQTLRLRQALHISLLIVIMNINININNIIIIITTIIKEE
jgi:hypothetical protein